MDVPPGKSRIKVEMEKGVRKITIPPDRYTLSFYAFFGTLLLLLFYMIQPASNVGPVLREIINSRFPYDPFSNIEHLFVTILAVLFLFFFAIVGWHKHAEIFLLRHEGLAYNSRVRRGFLKQERVDDSEVEIIFTPELLGTLKLLKLSSGNSLTIRLDGEFLDLATNASSLEREWLYGQIKEKYSL